MSNIWICNKHKALQSVFFVHFKYCQSGLNLKAVILQDILGPFKAIFIYFYIYLYYCATGTTGSLHAGVPITHPAILDEFWMRVWHRQLAGKAQPSWHTANHSEVLPISPRPPALVLHPAARIEPAEVSKPLNGDHLSDETEGMECLSNTGHCDPLIYPLSNIVYHSIIQNGSQ